MRLAIIAGDGIGPEVVGEAVKVLDAVLPGVEKTSYDLGARRFHATGEVLPDSVLDELRAHDAILLGAIGDPSVPSGVLERGLLLRIRFELDHHINLRPARLYPGVTVRWPEIPTSISSSCARAPKGPTPAPAARSGWARPNEIATEVSVNTAFGVRRVVHDAFERAQQRRKHLTLVHKNNVLTYAGALWWRTVQELAARVSRRRGRLPACRRRHDPHRHRSRPVRRDRHRQPVRRHHHRSRRGGVRRHRPGRQRQYRCDADESVDVRTRARQRARHRGPGHRRSDRGDHVGRAAAVPRRRGRRRGPRRQGRRAASGHAR